MSFSCSSPLSSETTSDTRSGASLMQRYKVTGSGCEQVGAFDRDPVKVARILADWFTVHRQQFDVMVERTKQMAAPNALFKIVADLAELAQIRTVARGGADGVLSLPANWNRAEIQGQPT